MPSHNGTACYLPVSTSITSKNKYGTCRHVQTFTPHQKQITCSRLISLLTSMFCNQISSCTLHFAPLICTISTYNRSRIQEHPPASPKLTHYH
jgi:hypothetical protein